MEVFRDKLFLSISNREHFHTLLRRRDLFIYKYILHILTLWKLFKTFKIKFYQGVSMSFLFGSRGRTRQLPTMTGQQLQGLTQLLQQIFGGGAAGFGESTDYLRGLLSGDPEAMRAFEAPHLRQFQEQTLPALTERLTGLGAGGGRASGAAQALSQAGQSLQEKL